ncbi:ABC transporter ATP-binding protein [Effusibacillus consociatus]|uniref:ABC transporter ATP-binding protein n=1 Tax=Effusibacillus consociatus TaxID=1117041 RepID=A0ABV9Q4T0_9BACL
MGKEIVKVESLFVDINHTPVLKGLNFKVNEGQICALLGHNGAGKTVTFRSMMGILKKKSGRILINGYDSEKEQEAYKQQFSYIPEEPMLFDELNVYQHFQVFALSYGVPEAEFKKRAHSYIEMFEMGEKVSEYPENLSKGMRQKVNIISSMIVDTPLLIVDEPFIGLDVEASYYLEQELKKRAERGMAVLLSSHVIEKVKGFCNTYIKLQKGEVVEYGDISNLRGFEVSKG